MYVNDKFTKDREAWKKELQRHCDEVYVDPEESIKVQKRRESSTSKKIQANILREMGEMPKSQEIWSDKHGQKMLENKANGPEDATASEMMEQLPQEKFSPPHNTFKTRYVGLVDAPSSWRIVKLIFLRKPDAAPGRGAG